MEELYKQFDELQIERESKQREIDNFELNSDDYEEVFNQELDDIYPELFNLSPSYILRECDPTQYRCALADYMDSVDIEENEDYQTLLEELDDIDKDIEMLEQEIEEIEEGQCDE